VTTDSGNLDPSVVLRAFPDLINANAVKFEKALRLAEKVAVFLRMDMLLLSDLREAAIHLEAVAVDIARVIERGLV